MPAVELGGVTLGLREGVIALIALVAGYMLFVLLRMRRLRRPSAVAAPAVASAESAESAPVVEVAGAPTAKVDTWDAPAGLAEEVLRHGLEQEVAQLRDEVDAIRGELAALRRDMQQEMAHVRASQTVSPIYGDAMQLAVSGYDAAAIAERCGIARAEAELVVALAQSQER